MKNELLHSLVSKRNLTILYLLTYGSTRTEEGCVIGRNLIRVSHLYYNRSEKVMMDAMFEEGLLEYAYDRNGTKSVVATEKGKMYLDKMMKVFGDIRPVLEKESEKMFEKGREKMRYITISKRESRKREKERTKE